MIDTFYNKKEDVDFKIRLILNLVQSIVEEDRRLQGKFPLIRFLKLNMKFWIYICEKISTS